MVATLYRGIQSLQPILVCPYRCPNPNLLGLPCIRARKPNVRFLLKYTAQPGMGMAGKRSAAELGEEALVRGFQQEWAFQGISAHEALGHIADTMYVKADLLVLQRRVGDRIQIVGGDVPLVAGNDYEVRLRREAVVMRRFGAGVAVSSNSHYYVPPDVDELVSDLLHGKYCVLCGPRQSGKTTMVMEARRKLAFQSGASVVYLDGLLGVKESWNSHGLWGYLCDSLHLKCPSLFRARNKQEICSDVEFRSLFLKGKLLSPVILVLDEADSLLQLSPNVIAEFFAVVRSMKNDRGSDGSSPYNLEAFMLVGVETVKDLIEGQYDKRVNGCLGSGRVYQPGRMPSRLSPFPHDHVIKAERFTLEEVENLLEQAAADRPKVGIEVHAIAQSIFEYTGGHKGLTGTCLAYVMQEQLWTFKAWLARVESYLLGAYVFSMETYSRILSFIRLQERIPKALEALLQFLAVDGIYCHGSRLLELRDFIAHGVLSSTSVDGESSYVCMSSPLLRTAILRRCTITGYQVDPPPCATRLDRSWLMLEAIKTLDGETMCQKARGAGSSEYIHQFVFLCRVKAILEQTYPTIQAKVLFEVKEEILEGERRSQLRCDSLIRDGYDLSKFALEFLANGTLAQILEHLQRALKYHDQHSAQVFVVNFCMEKSKEDEHMVIPTHDALVFVSVNFRPGRNAADVTFVDASGHYDYHHEVSLRNWTGTISFGNLC